MIPLYRNLSAPLTAQVEVTGKCNVACLHCYNYWKNDEARKESYGNAMTLDVARKVLDEIVKCQIFSLVITGGEPLLNLPIVKFFLENAYNNGIVTSMNSNVTLLTRNILEELKSLHLGGVLTSVLGSNPEVHDSITQVRGAFAKTIRGVRYCVEADMPVMCNMVVSAKNINDVRNTASMLKELRVKSFSATPVCRPSNCQDFSSLELTREQTLKVYNELIWVKNNLRMNVATLVAAPMCIFPSLDEMAFDINKCCSAGSSFAMISSGGRMRPCPNFDIEYGSILEEGIKAV